MLSGQDVASCPVQVWVVFGRSGGCPTSRFGDVPWSPVGAFMEIVGDMVLGFPITMTPVPALTSLHRFG